MTKGLFVGLTTLDLIYLIKNLPESNQKIVANEQIIAAGGPATNAAVTFSYLGNKSTLLTVLGNHAVSNLIRQDLSKYDLQIIDLAQERQESPPVSSIMVTQSTGARAIISVNSTKYQAEIDRLSEDILQDIDIILLDGHQREISRKIALQARSFSLPVVIDAGSWKPGLENILPLVDYAICSADFYPPECQNHRDVFQYLSALGIEYIAITDGENPIQYLAKEKFGTLPVLPVKVVDTLGAGDIFHGAFCHHILHNSFSTALSKAAEIASSSCEFFGTRFFKKNT